MNRSLFVGKLRPEASWDNRQLLDEANLYKAPEDPDSLFASHPAGYNQTLGPRSSESKSSR